MADLSLTNFLQTLNSKINNYNLSRLNFFYDGTNISFDSWIQNLDKFTVIYDIPDENKSLIAFKSSRSIVSDFIQNWLQKNANENWPELKLTLNERFGEFRDEYVIFRRLRAIIQHNNEPILAFAQRLREIADKCFELYDQKSNLIQTQLIGIFTDGLHKDEFKLKIIQENPKTLQDAIDLISKEERSLQIFNIRYGRHFKIQNGGHDTSTLVPEIAGNTRPLMTELPEDTRGSIPELAEDARTFIATAERDQLPRTCFQNGGTFGKLPRTCFQNGGTKRKLPGTDIQNGGSLGKLNRYIRCSFCLKRGHEVINCRKRNNKRSSVDSRHIKLDIPTPRKKSVKRCYFCGSGNHLQATCKQFSKLVDSDSNNEKTDDNRLNLN